MEKRNFVKVYISGMLTVTYFWIVIAVPYLLDLGFGIEQVYILMSIYSISNVILEFPTGVIGDHFGHRISVLLGLLINGTVFLLFLLNPPQFSYFIFMVLLAAGNSLVSGSDVALLKKVSTNFKSQYANYHSMQDVVLFLVSVLGGLLITMSYYLPLIITSIAYFIAVVLLSTLKIDESERGVSGNIFATAKGGLNVLKKNKKIQLIIFIFVALYAFGRSLKNILATFPEISDIDLGLVGVLVGTGMLMRAFGIKISQYIDINERYLGIIFILLLLSSSFGNINMFIPPLALILSNFLMGIIKTKLELKINDNISDKFRASILSLNNLLVRFVASIYLLYAGYALDILSYNFLIITTATALILVLVIYSFNYKKIN